MTIELRRYAAHHTLDTTAALRATVIWNGKTWNVHLDDEQIPDCCDTIEEAYAAAEAEIRRRFPGHTCSLPGCRPWERIAEV